MGHNPSAIATEDINHEGSPDLASAIATADFNHDGKLDLAVASRDDSSVSVLLGNGNGIFRPAPGSPIVFPEESYPVTFHRQVFNGKTYVAQADTQEETTSSTTYDLAVGDFNHDGAPDLAVTAGLGDVHILLGNGDGSFTEAPTSPIFVGAPPSTDGSVWMESVYPAQIVAGDFNHDGRLDLAVTDLDNHSVDVLLGDGFGGFHPAPGSPYDVGDQPVSLVAGDFRHTGRSDLAALTDAGSIAVLLSQDLSPASHSSRKSP